MSCYCECGFVGVPHRSLVRVLFGCELVLECVGGGILEFDVVVVTHCC